MLVEISPHHMLIRAVKQQVPPLSVVLLMHDHQIAHAHLLKSPACLLALCQE